ncbi:PP2C family protein-serine/threonine phosphatase [Myceligenerans pegani]|uniref:Fused response regulator/phosphatase n=1 Tax=Myceligenerans pegani TaxID=2776917 RepID=A0ABR9N020_9MICO|nr:fused response regulator/phosphatase [Myceligenerans sp. TRM 65318]MBE1876428.1 fused response regulator/phosphatase [Myceligenerans sp. TRM 65318]MBE3018699.1 fused response regulator/phosphatase [Myceligenerans sp. TRM 65318]
MDRAGAAPRDGAPGDVPGAFPPEPPEPLSVLLVEDDDADAFLVTDLLAHGGVRADMHRARRVTEALSILDDIRVDCLLLDLGLPDAVGLSALERVVAHVDSLPVPPAVVVLTGDVAAGAGTKAMAAGADDYLVKGEVDGDRLARALRYATLRRRSAAQQLALYRSEVRAAETMRLERALLPEAVVRDERISLMVGYLPGGNGLLGGDFFDAVERPDGTLMIVVGDVAGHGPDEAALGAAMRTAWRTLVLSGTDPGDILPLMERVLLPERRGPEVFVTLCQVVVAAGRDAMDVYLAGHPPPLLATRTGDRTECAELTGLGRGRALGIPARGGWEATRVALPGQWTVVLFTDGLVEAKVTVDDDGAPTAPDERGRLPRLGVDGLRAVVSAELAGGSHDVVPRVLRRVRTLHGGPLADDAALLLAGWDADADAGSAERTSTLADSTEWGRA